MQRRQGPQSETHFLTCLSHQNCYSATHFAAGTSGTGPPLWFEGFGLEKLCTAGGFWGIAQLWIWASNWREQLLNRHECDNVTWCELQETPLQWIQVRISSSASAEDSSLFLQAWKHHSGLLNPLTFQHLAENVPGHRQKHILLVCFYFLVKRLNWAGILYICVSTWSLLVWSPSWCPFPLKGLRDSAWLSDICMGMTTKDSL